MRTLIVDDEPAARRRLATMLAELDVEVVGEAADGVEALRLAAERRPDLLLLDIAMPEVDGFDVVRHLERPRPLIVFQTAFDDHALEAFDHEALDYVVKPVTLERLSRAVERARERLAATDRREPTEHALRRVAARLPVPTKPRLLVRSGRGHRLLPVAEIRRFSADDGLTYAHSGDGRHVTDYTLAELEARTAGYFVRVSRSALVHVEHVDRIVSNGDGSATLTLSDGTPVRASRRRAADVRRTLEQQTQVEPR